MTVWNVGTREENLQIEADRAFINADASLSLLNADTAPANTEIALFAPGAWVYAVRA